MRKQVEIIPKQYPKNLLDKDWSQRKCYFRSSGVEYLKRVHDLEVYADDVWLVTLPKCGTTWMQELLWLVMNDFDFETAKAEHLDVRSPFMEFNFLINENLDTAFAAIENLKRPRLIKSHLPLPLLPAQLWAKKPKTIYVFRNLKDAYVSDYYHGQMVGNGLNRSIEDSIRSDCMIAERVHEPFNHATEFYALRNEPWLYYTSFEKMKLNLREVIEDICKFLNKTITETMMERMLKHLSFEEMKQNSKTNHLWEFEQVRKKIGQPYNENLNFVRKGEMNGYKKELSAELIADLDKWINENFQKLNITMDELLLLKE